MAATPVAASSPSAHSVAYTVADELGDSLDQIVRRGPTRSLSVVQDLRNEIRCTRNEQAVIEIDRAISGVRSWREEQAARVASLKASLQVELDAEAPAAPSTQRAPPLPPQAPQPPASPQRSDENALQPAATAGAAPSAERAAAERRVAAQLGTLDADLARLIARFYAS